MIDLSVKESQQQLAVLRDHGTRSLLQEIWRSSIKAEEIMLGLRIKGTMSAIRHHTQDAA